MAKKAVVRKKNNISKIKVKKAGSRLVLFIGLVMFLSVVATVFSQALLSQVTYDVEKLKEQVNQQEKTNQSLSMKISELASLDKIQEVAESEGLRYNNNNIKSVSTSG